MIPLLANRFRLSTATPARVFQDATADIGEVSDDGQYFKT